LTNRNDGDVEAKTVSLISEYEVGKAPDIQSWDGSSPVPRKAINVVEFNPLRHQTRASAIIM